jgi:hypothetical protein
MGANEDHINQADKNVNHWRRTMRIVFAILGLTAFAVLVTACGDGATATDANQIEGPAMIMFYTDG